MVNSIRKMTIAALALTGVCMAQDIRSTLRIQVKPERTADWVAAVKDAKEVYKKAGFDRTRTVWQSVSGPTQFLRVEMLSKWAQLDPGIDPQLKGVAEDITRIMARVQQCTESSERVFSQVDQDLSLPRPKEMPKLVRVIRTRVKPGRMDAYRQLFRSEYMPALKKTNPLSYVTLSTRWGGPRTEVVTALGLNGYADLDAPAPIMQAMGQEKWAQFVSRLMELVEHQEHQLYRLREDLSYFPAK